VVEHGTSGRREVALTFDAGPDRGYAEEILDLLAAEGVAASFGIMGQWVEANPDLVRRMVAEGHLLFNHSWSHPSFTGASTGEGLLPTEARLAEVRQTEALVRDLTGYDLRPYFRPPYGDHDEGVLADLDSAGYAVTLLWSCDSRDSLGATAEEILSTCTDAAQPGPYRPPARRRPVGNVRGAAADDRFPARAGVRVRHGGRAPPTVTPHRDARAGDATPGLSALRGLPTARMTAASAKRYQANGRSVDDLRANFWGNVDTSRIVSYF
jgi:peptidoglycan/xylan/chitin deacetylase (PgdA/CDA1 family)